MRVIMRTFDWVAKISEILTVIVLYIAILYWIQSKVLNHPPSSHDIKIQQPIKPIPGTLHGQYIL
jgi:hypothetical protein